MDDKILRKLQLTELSILNDIHEYCIKYNIKYSLYAGTLIGAVRHKGFIPWDDDIDIIMTRDEYNNFLNAWKKNPLEGYYLENFINEPKSCINHIKIRKNNTIILSEGEKEGLKHNGVWIDIFVLDKVKNDKKSARHIKRQLFKILLATRGNEIYETSKGISFIIKKMIGSIPLKIKRKLFISGENGLQKFKDIKDDYYYICAWGWSGLKECYTKELIESYSTIEFEGYDFMTFKDADGNLRAKYGDYMVMPPKEKQVCTHNPVKIVL